ncbi:MAG: hypothetical protein NVSMB23_17960 [Myxococcales bacterium]
MFRVDGSVGNSNFTAVFDAPFGERITALSSEVGCSLTYDDKAFAAAGRCSVPLTSVRVDGDDVKAGHFQQWATNKKSDPKDCALAAIFENIQLDGPLAAGKPARFKGTAAFTVCGRKRTDGASEPIEGTAMLFPAGTYNKEKTLKLRARIEKFSRDRYHVGPRYTDGWSARIQQLAPIVADEGMIDLVLFAKAGAAKTASSP